MNSSKNCKLNADLKETISKERKQTSVWYKKHGYPEFQDETITISKAIKRKRASAKTIAVNEEDKENNQAIEILDRNPNGSFAVPVDFLGFLQSGSQVSYKEWKKSF